MPTQLFSFSYEYWFAAPDLSDSQGDSPIELYITTTSTASDILISIPQNGSFTPISRSLSAWDTETITLTAYKSMLEPSSSGIAESKGLLIETTEEVSITYAVMAGSSKVYYTLKGTAAYGTEFVFPGQTKWSRDGSLSTTPTNSMDIVSLRDETEVKVYLSNDANGYSNGDTITFTLDRGQTYSVQNSSTNSGDNLIGSEIYSSEYIAVTYTEDAVEKSSTSDALGDQIIPVNRAGTEYVGYLGKLADGANSKDYLVVQSITDGTHQVQVGNFGTHTFNNKGEVRVYDILNPTSFSVTSDDNVLVYQYSGVGDHLSMSLLPPVDECSGSDEVAIHRPTSDDFYVMVFVPNGGQNHFSSNISPNPFKNSNMSNLTGLSWKCGIIQIASNKLSAGSTLELTNSKSVFYAYVLHGDSSDGAVFGTASPFFLEGLSVIEMFHF
ncbi:MAG: hypothetical protein SchgKO_01180 [Schleiferiaceae bacterium]